MTKSFTHRLSSFHVLRTYSIKLFVLLLICFRAADAYCQEPVTLTTIIVFRHAEKVTDPNNQDPGLSDEGLARAKKIATLFQEDSINAVYATPYQRTKHTVKPLAESQNLPVTEYPPADEEAFAAMLTRHEGHKIVICGHSNTVPLLLNHFTESTTHSSLKEDEYDKIYIIIKSSTGKSATLKLSLHPN